MRRKRRGKSAPAFRLPDEVTTLVRGLVEKTGWSPPTALTFLANAGANAVAKADKIPGYRELLKAAVEHHEAEVNARKKLAATSSKLREARKVLASTKERR